MTGVSNDSDIIDGRMNLFIIYLFIYLFIYYYLVFDMIYVKLWCIKNVQVTLSSGLNMVIFAQQKEKKR